MKWMVNSIYGFSHFQSNILFYAESFQCRLKMSFRSQQYRNKGSSRKFHVEKDEDPFGSNNGRGKHNSRGGRPPPGLVSINHIEMSISISTK